VFWTIMHSGSEIVQAYVINTQRFNKTVNTELHNVRVHSTRWSCFDTTVSFSGSRIFKEQAQISANIWNYIPNMQFSLIDSLWPITVAARSKAWNVFDRSNDRNVGSNLTQGMDFCLGLFCLYCPVYE
jgi:hypothetical protein